MARKHAKTLTDDQLKELLNTLPDVSRNPVVDRAVFLLSYKGGMRAQEIAGVRWIENIFNARGTWNTTPVKTGNGRPLEVLRIFIGGDIGKYGRERPIPAHPLLFDALRDLYAERYNTPFVIPSARPSASQELAPRAHALATRIARLYAEMGFVGCSSHSGRRTAITKLSRVAPNHQSGLKDVQLFAGHRHLSSTEAYLDPSENMVPMVFDL